MVIDPTNPRGILEDNVFGGNPSQPGSVFLLELISKVALTRGSPTTLCRINEPPRGRDVNVVIEEDLVKRTITFALERDVDKGEELFIDYGLNYDRSHYDCSSVARDRPESSSQSSDISAKVKPLTLSPSVESSGA